MNYKSLHMEMDSLIGIEEKFFKDIHFRIQHKPTKKINEFESSFIMCDEITDRLRNEQFYVFIETEDLEENRNQIINFCITFFKDLDIKTNLRTIYKLDVSDKFIFVDCRECEKNKKEHSADIFIEQYFFNLPFYRVYIPKG